MLPLPLDAVIVLGAESFRWLFGSVSLTLPLSVFAVTWYTVWLGGRTSVMLPLSVFTRTLPGMLLNLISMLPSPLEAVMVSVAMPDPVMLPLSVFMVIVVDVTPVAWMLPSPDEADSAGDLTALT